MHYISVCHSVPPREPAREKGLDEGIIASDIYVKSIAAYDDFDEPWILLTT